MSAEDDALREMAANRGCKLVKSRRRKPGGDYGRYGLKDAKSGKEMLGFGPDGLTATAREIKAFLRGGAAASWKSSLRSAAAARPAPPVRKAARAAKTRPSPPVRKSARAAKTRPARAHRPEPPRRQRRAAPPAPPPKPPRPPKIREARPADAEAIARLLVELGYDVTAADVRRRLAALRRAGEPALVADRGGVLGCLSWHVTPVIHRPRPVGRITMLVVAEAERGAGLGAGLVAAAEARLRERGCGLVEVTSNMKRMRAHAFYQRLGYERTSFRFAKTLQE